MKSLCLVVLSVVPACVEPRVPAGSLRAQPAEAHAVAALEPSQGRVERNAPGPPFSTPSSAAPAPSLPEPSHGSTSPLDVSWVPGQVSDTRAVLRARVEQRARLAIPLTLRVTMPPGVRMVRGAATIPLPPGTQQAISEYEFEFVYSGMPSDDIMLAVDGDTEAMGVHGRAAFRFGRPEPEGPRPQPSGPPLVIGGRNFGSPVNAAP